LVYLFGCIYILHIRYIFPVLEDYSHFLEKVGLFRYCRHWEQKKYEIYKVLLYVIMNSIPTSFLTFFSGLKTYDSISVSTVLGNMFFLFFLVTPVIVLINGKPYKSDSWLFSRDGVVTLVALGLLITFLALDYQFYFGIIMFCVYLVFWVVNIKNEFFMHKIFEILRIISEDESFNADLIKKRDTSRYDIEYLCMNFLNKSDSNLKKELLRQDGYFKIQSESSGEINLQARNNWAKLVYQIIFALRAKNKKEKEARSAFYYERVEAVTTALGLRKVTEDDMGKENQHGQGPDVPGEGLGKRESQIEVESEKNIPDKIKLVEDDPIQEFSELKQSQEPEKAEAAVPLEEAEQEDLRSKISIEEVTTVREKEEEALKKKLQDYSSKKTMLSPPESILKKILWFFFLPSIVALWVVPNIHKNPTIRKTIWSTMISVILLILISFVVLWFELLLADAFDIPEVLFGLLLNGVGLNVAFAVYTYKNCNVTKEANVYLAIQEIGIFQVLVCIGGSWLVGGIFTDYSHIFIEQEELVIMSSVFTGAWAFSFVFQLASKLRVSKLFGWVFPFAYAGLLIGLIILSLRSKFT
jgi:Ca2+/Na+ antiporter